MTFWKGGIFLNILMIGDIVGDCGVRFVRMRLPEIKQAYQIDFCIANGENAANGNGITSAAYHTLCDSGVDAFTMGNHTYGKKDVIPLLLHRDNIIRPINYPEGAVGRGSMIVRCKGKSIGIVNALGRVNLMNVDCPFRAVERELAHLAGNCDITIVDFHAETTSEKLAMGYFLDGRATCVLGTHTHVQTADAGLLPRGTGYITDVGMTGAICSILGVKKEIIIDRFLTQLPQRFENADGKASLSGAVFTIDDNTNRCTSVQAIGVQ